MGYKQTKLSLVYKQDSETSCKGETVPLLISFLSNEQ